MTKLSLFSPAKINLFLRIHHKRTDGYHGLSSVLQALDFGDTLDIEPANEDSLTCEHPFLLCDSTNLISKAIELFRRKTGSTLHFKIRLVKRIPLESGLGGGSSNAASALWACNQLSGIKASSEDLKLWAGEIGSDVPFFLSSGTALCTGRGEKVFDLPETSPRDLWIIKPKKGISTGDVYRKLTPFSSSEEIDPSKLIQEGLTFYNDLEVPAFALRPDLEALKKTLIDSGFETVQMSGSGSSFFCFGAGIPPVSDDLEIFRARFLNRSVHDWYKKSEGSSD